MAEILFPLAERVVVTHVNNPRAATTMELRKAAARTGTSLYEEESAATAVARAGILAKRDGLIVVTGSIFLVGEVMAAMGIPT
jgi:dihydrofolate synthase/folylpolyglutamate synthase